MGGGGTDVWRNITPFLYPTPRYFRIPYTQPDLDLYHNILHRMQIHLTELYINSKITTTWSVIAATLLYKSRSPQSIYWFILE